VDRIVIKGLLTRCILGINDEERREKQDVVVDLILQADLRPAARHDSFADAVDYRAIKKGVFELVEGSHHYLAEALAEEIAALCLRNPLVTRVTVMVEKPSALRFARSVAVEITRDRE
jgi:FolB domain-containing protein